MTADQLNSALVAIDEQNVACSIVVVGERQSIESQLARLEESTVQLDDYPDVESALADRGYKSQPNSARNASLILATIASESEGNRNQPTLGIGCIVQPNECPANLAAAHWSMGTTLIGSDSIDVAQLIGIAIHSTISGSTDTLPKSAQIEIERLSGDPLLVEVASNQRTHIWFKNPTSFVAAAPQPFQGLLSGSFNPLHSGHVRMRHAAAQFLGGSVHFELPIANADKPPLDYLTVAERLGQFDDAPIAVSSTATFVEKAAIYPGTTFVVGYDTAVRILMPKFYGDEQQMKRSLEDVRDNGCSFLVAGRQIDSEFQTLSDLKIPTGMGDLFQELPEASFRHDVSSSEIRQRRT